MNSDYQIEVSLRSEAIFSSGEKERNLVQTRVLADRYGFVYFHAKSFKGQLKRQAFWLLRQYRQIGLEHAMPFFSSIVVLFGINDEEINKFFPRSLTEHDPVFQRKYHFQQPGIMRLSHLQLDERVRNRFIALQIEDEEEGYFRLNPHEFIEAQTHIRTGIQLQDGVAANRMMNTYHTVRQGLVFYSSLFLEPHAFSSQIGDMKIHLQNLQRIVSSFRRIGAGIHRGRGEVKARLLVNGKEADFCKFEGKEGERHAAV